LLAPTQSASRAGSANAESSLRSATPSSIDRRLRSLVRDDARAKPWRDVALRPDGVLVRTASYRFCHRVFGAAECLKYCFKQKDRMAAREKSGLSVEENPRQK
jgi:hypothetical protein